MEEKKDVLDNDQIIALMAVYLEDRNHRDQLGTDHIFKFFYASIIIGLVPNLSAALGTSFDFIPSIVFRIVGLLIAGFYIYVASAYADRLNAMSSSYARLIDMLPESYHRTPIKAKYDKYMSTWISNCMFIASILLQITMLISDFAQPIPKG